MSRPENQPLLRLSEEEMRAFGYRVVDQLVQHFIGLRDEPVTRKRTPADMQRRLREPAPEQGSAPEAVLEQATRDVLASLSRTHHPRFFAYVPSPSNFVSVMAEALAAGYNVFGYDDKELAMDEYTNKGFYTRFRFKFDEDSFDRLNLPGFRRDP